MDAPHHRVLVWPWLRPLGQRFLLPSWLAITIGRWIFAWRALDEAELAHELTHVAQWRSYGILYMPRYLRPSWRA